MNPKHKTTSSKENPIKTNITELGAYFQDRIQESEFEVNEDVTTQPHTMQRCSYTAEKLRNGASR